MTCMLSHLLIGRSSGRKLQSLIIGKSSHWFINFNDISSHSLASRCLVAVSPEVDSLELSPHFQTNNSYACPFVRYAQDFSDRRWGTSPVQLEELLRCFFTKRLMGSPDSSRCRFFAGGFYAWNNYCRFSWGRDLFVLGKGGLITNFSGTRKRSQLLKSTQEFRGTVVLLDILLLGISR